MQAARKSCLHTDLRKASHLLTFNIVLGFLKTWKRQSIKNEGKITRSLDLELLSHRGTYTNDASERMDAFAPKKSRAKRGKVASCRHSSRGAHFDNVSVSQPRKKTDFLLEGRMAAASCCLLENLHCHFL